MDVLRARAEIKNTFRLPVTVIQRSENNPLKFALGTDEAIRKILAPPDPAFLTGLAAFDDAFDDIKDGWEENYLAPLKEFLEVTED